MSEQFQSMLRETNEHRINVKIQLLNNLTHMISRYEQCNMLSLPVRHVKGLYKLHELMPHNNLYALDVEREYKFGSGGNYFVVGKVGFNVNANRLYIMSLEGVNNLLNRNGYKWDSKHQSWNKV